MKKNRSFGIIGIGADKALWNADFDGNPNQCLGEFVGSPMALKYAYRRYWKEIGEKILLMKSFYEKTGEKDGQSVIVPKSLDKVLEDLINKNFGEQVTKTEEKGKKAKKKVKTAEVDIENMVFDYLDVACFGGAFASKVFNKSYVGTIQFGYGVNKYEDSEIIRNASLSPFQNNNKEDNKQTTIGSRVYLSEGHFFYDFVVNPNINFAYKETNEKFKGLTDEEYKKFKDASLVCASSLTSLTKKGCYNEFAMFVELKEGSNKYLGSLNKKIKFYKENNKGVIDLSLIEADIKAIYDDVESIEIYHNPVDTKVIIGSDSKIKIMNILNENEVDFTAV